MKMFPRHALPLQKVRVKKNKSSGLPLLLLAIVIGVGYTAVNGASAKPDMSRCVDYHDRVVSSELCKQSSPVVKVAGSIYAESEYRHYYGGYGSHDIGSKAWGGSDRPIKGELYEETADTSAAQSGEDPRSSADFAFDEHASR